MAKEPKERADDGGETCRYLRSPAYAHRYLRSRPILPSSLGKNGASYVGSGTVDTRSHQSHASVVKDRLH